jgi:translation initiation factor 3 subunit G
VQELFRPFGPISRVFLAVDRTTGENRGFAFVNYVYREDAERAIRNLNGAHRGQASRQLILAGHGV